MSFVDLIVN